VIADVSGKGIPAAMFMMNCKVTLQSIAASGRSAAEILTRANNAVCANNNMEMFVTVWLGILNVDTGKLDAANAGHEYPVIKRAGGDFELIKDKHGLVIGAMEGVQYTGYELQLEAGDTLFVYTDGVAEATNAYNELVGTDRMLDALNKDPDAMPEQLLENVMEGINDFVQGAEQFDDITMLSLKYNGPQ
jgi:sigma-B regulation protein RsbU (phosphoserine phosphatase)